jgi:DNA-binding transcriptional ArsR family regulator
MPRGHRILIEGYTISELQVLWYLRVEGNGTILGGESPAKSIISKMARDLDVPASSVGNALRKLEEKALILRTYKRESTNKFHDSQGFNPLLKVEMIDSEMEIPMIPAEARKRLIETPAAIEEAPPVVEPELPLIEDVMPVTVMQRENADLLERERQRRLFDPSPDAIILALLERNEELRAQIEKLQTVVIDLQAEAESKERTIKALRDRPRRVDDGLTSRIRDALTDEQWDKLGGVN